MMDGRCFIVSWRNAGWYPLGKANLIIKQSTIDTLADGMSLFINEVRDIIFLDDGVGTGCQCSSCR